MRHLGHGVLAAGAELVGVVGRHIIASRPCLPSHRVFASAAQACRNRLRAGLHVRLLSPGRRLGIGAPGGGKRGGDNQNRRVIRRCSDAWEVQVIGH